MWLQDMVHEMSEYQGWKQIMAGLSDKQIKKF